MALDCLIAGDANVDLLMEARDQLQAGAEMLASNMNLVLGGSSAITAFNLARLGAKVGFISVVGEDLLGRFVEDKLSSAGIDMSGLRRSKQESTGLTVWISRKQQRAGLTYPGTISALRAKDIGLQQLGNARHFHVGHYFLLTKLHPEAPGLFAKAKRLGLTTSLDCNYDPVEQWDSNIWKVLEHTDIFAPNEQEALRLTGETNVERASRQLSEIVRIVTIKRGARGALVRSREELLRVPAVKTRVVDTAGAGDSFNAGFLSEFLKGSSLARCALAAVKAAARCVAAVGGTAAFEKKS